MVNNGQKWKHISALDIFSNQKLRNTEFIYPREYANNVSKITDRLQTVAAVRSDHAAVKAENSL